MSGNRKVKCVCEGAVMVAAAVVLNFLRLPTDWMAGTGGSVELTMIPIVIYALRRGPGWGMGAGLIFGVLKCIIGGGIAYGWQALLLDYAAAFAVVGAAGFLRRKPGAAALLGAFCRYVMHVISGAVIWGEWMPGEFLNMEMTNVWVYSALYNGVYMVCNAVISVAVIAILGKKTVLIGKK